MKKKFYVTAVIMAFAMALGTPAAKADKPDLPRLPPLNEPATKLVLPGKFVWSDLFSADMSATRTFYTSLFGWEWRSISAEPRPYGIFYKDGIAVAGLTNRQHPKDGQVRSAWVHYASVADVARTATAFEAQGGRTLLGRRTMPDRGEFAILADPAGAVVGVLRSSSGDPGDFGAEIGEFIWFELFTRDLSSSADFYKTLFGYYLYHREDVEEVVEYILATDGYARAGVGSMPKGSDAPPTWLGYVRVRDVAETIDKATKLGGRVLLEPSADVLDGGLAIIADPEGTPVGIMEWTYPEEASQ